MQRKLRKMIEEGINSGLKLIIYPFGDIGMQVKNILNTAYGIQEAYIIDDNLCKYNKNIKGTDLFRKINCNEYVVLLSLLNSAVYNELRERVGGFFKKENIVSLIEEKENVALPKKYWWERVNDVCYTVIGKYSSGPICKNHQLIESIGAFCSFAEGVCVHGNHSMEYVTTHPMLYKGSINNPLDNQLPYEEYNEAPWYFDGVCPKGRGDDRAKRITIGNDVWLGRNVVIVNYSNIGNGVIAGAGAIITHDIPDYAVVAGVPARIIRYRYNQEQIAALNEIKWWDWPDWLIRERFDDFYLPIDEFIERAQKLRW